MSNFFSDVLGNSHPLLVKTIADFERASGNHGIDTKLIADVTEKAHRIMRELGIDPSDSSGRELYYALQSRVQQKQSIEVFLSDTAYVLVRFDDGPVSLNIQDVIENTHHEIRYEDRTYAHGQRHLRAEIIKRYADSDRTDDSMIHVLSKQSGLAPLSDEGHADTTDVVKDNDSKTILAIGDIFTDAFIQLSDNVAKVETDSDGSAWLKLPFGSKPPYERVDIVRAVGPSPNAAVSFARLGLKTELVSWLGADQAGGEAIQYLTSEHVGTTYTVKKPGTSSNYYYVLRVGAERTILVKNEDYDYVWQEPQHEPDWIYLSLISSDSWPLHEDLMKYLEAHPDVKFAFQPGTFHFIWGADKLKRLYGRSDIVILNKEEAIDITKSEDHSIPALASALHELGPKRVVITDGPHGSYASYEDKVVSIENYPDPAPPVDRTGAGDAFASTIVAALASGESMDTALLWAPINSMSVVQQLGAQTGLLTKAEILVYLENAPESYALKSVSN